jgi:hypothetical protein
MKLTHDLQTRMYSMSILRGEFARFSEQPARGEGA